MKQNRKQRSELARNGYEAFKGYPVKTTMKKVDFEQHFVVPWEMTGDKQRIIYSKS